MDLLRTKQEDHLRLKDVLTLRNCRKLSAEKIANNMRILRHTIESVQGMLSKYHKNLRCLELRSGESHRDTLIRCDTCQNTWWAQIASVHAGKGCLRCSIEKKSLSEEVILERLKKIHEDRYEYGVLCKTKDRFSFKCKSCNQEISMLMSNHLLGTGCISCYRRTKVNTKSFIERSKKRHGDKYDYSRCIYTGSMEKVTIGCKKCNSWFEQTANNHVNIGNGCPECALNMMISNKETAWLDLLGINPQHRNIEIAIDNKTYNVDALVGTVIYEYYGSYFHGDPRITKPNQLIGSDKRPASECFSYTLARHEMLKRKGYEIRYVWEEDADHGATFSASHPTCLLVST